MHPSLKIYDEAIKNVIHTGFEIVPMANDCSFTEGPVWNTKGYYLFSDIDRNTIYKISEGAKKEIYIAESGTKNIHAAGIRPDHAGSNALAYDTDGSLLICQHGDHGVAKWKDGVLQTFLTGYNGRPFNSPNDIVISAKGKIFFSDPPYGLKDAKPNPEDFQPLAGVYCWQGGDVKLVCDKYQYPNGVCITPDGRDLYICSNKPYEKFISVYDVETLAYKRLLAQENSDGIKCDPQGHVYLCTNDGIVVINSKGDRLALLRLPTIPANSCWGGSGLKDLFITARENVFLIKDLLK